MHKMEMEQKMDDSTLVFVQVLFRHGIRAPDYSYQGDPYESVKYLPFGKGRLTPAGRKQGYDFGKCLRKRYNTFLGPEFNEGMLEAHSSEVRRAQMTLQLVLAGLFPPTDENKIADDLNWQPITYQYKPRAEDELIGCMISQAYTNINQSGFNKSQNCIELLQLVKEKLGRTIENFGEVVAIFDTIRVQVDNGLAMPEWIKDVYDNKLVPEVACYMTENYRRKNYLRKGCSGLFAKIFDEMEARVIGGKDGKPKIILYSGHDINVFALMKVLKFPDLGWPKYISSLIFELHTIGVEYVIKVMFIDGYVPKKDYVPKSEPVHLKTPNNEESWNIQQLKTYVEESFNDIERSN